MNAESAVKLIEEMMDLKVQRYAESNMRPTPEVARILQEKQETDRRRLEQIRTELVRVLGLEPGAARVNSVQARLTSDKRDY